jgi:hypothetical protein
MQLISFLNQNSAAIQALVSLLSFFVTAILAFITWRYVQLTKSIAAASQRTVGLHEEAQQARERQLDAVLNMVEQRLQALPYDQAQAEDIRGATTWDSQLLFELQQLAGAEGHDPGQGVAALIARLKWLDERILEVKNTPVKTGVDWPRFPWPRWREELSKARSEIPVIRLDLRNVRRGYKLR